MFRRSLGIVVAGLALAALLVGRAGPPASAAIESGGLRGRVTHLDIGSIRSKGLDQPYLFLYSLSGATYVETEPDASGRWAMGSIRPGRYKIGWLVSPGGLPFRTMGKNDASFFYSASGGTTSWSRATVVTVTDGRTATVNLSARSGARLSGTVIGRWPNGAGSELTAFPVAGAPQDARGLLARIDEYTSPVKPLSGGRVEYRFTSGGLLPGSYRLAATRLAGAHPTLYYTGDGRKASSTASKAKVITVTNTSAVIRIGTFTAR